MTHEAIEVADEVGDVELLARAGEMTSIGSLWTPAGGVVDDLVVDALRRALDALPDGDDQLRCRVMLALAGEIYHGATAKEREALADEAVAMARRLGDRPLFVDAGLKALTAIWSPASTKSGRSPSRRAIATASSASASRSMAVAPW